MLGPKQLSMAEACHQNAHLDHTPMQDCAALPRVSTALLVPQACNQASNWDGAPGLEFKLFTALMAEQCTSYDHMPAQLETGCLRS